MAYNLLKGKRGIITGALDSNSIAWKVAEKAYEEGATFVLTTPLSQCVWARLIVWLKKQILKLFQPMRQVLRN